MMDSKEAEAILEKLDKGIFLMIHARSRLAKVVKHESENESKEPDASSNSGK